MSKLRILHVDDEPDIREVVEASLMLDPDFFVRSCGSGEEAVAIAPDWRPDLILCDVMMPVMDGPATLARLRESPGTEKTPVIFMTARAQPRELEHFKSLGAAGVIAKPFDPLTLCAQVRDLYFAASLAKQTDAFDDRLRANAGTLGQLRTRLRDEPSSGATLAELETCAHKLAGAAGIFGRQTVSKAARELEETIIEQHAVRWATPGKVERDLDALLGCITSALGGAKGEMARDHVN
jgi:two-component system OmpR family response regulator